MRSAAPVNPFQSAVEATIGAPPQFYSGLGALGKYSTKILEQNCRILGSVRLDGIIPDARWDYGIGLQSADSAFAIWVEVHHASTGEVGTVIQKLQWLKQWLSQNAPQLKSLTPPDGFYWLSTNGVNITRNSPQARRLAEAGLKMPRNVLVVPHCK